MNKIKILAVVAIVLGLGVVVKNVSQKSRSVADEVSAKEILSKDFDIAKVTKLVLYANIDKDNTKETQKVEVIQTEGAWSITTSFGAPGNTQKITELLQELANAYGVLRSTNTKFHEEYQVTEDLAFHVEIYRGDEKDHFLVGKRIDSESCFFRYKDDNKVYRVGGEIRSKLDLSGDTNEIRKETWIEKKIVNVKTDQINKFSLTYPDKKLEFSKVQKVTENSNKPQYDWQITEGSFGRDYKNNEVISAFLEKISEYAVTDIVDPANKKEYGLENPNFRLEVSLVDGTKKIIHASHLNTDGDGYCFLESNPNFIYRLENWRFKEVFKPGSEIFDLPKLKVDAKEITTVSVTTPNGEVVLKQDANAWSVDNHPHHNVNKDVVKEFVDSLKEISADDYTSVEDTAILGLENAKYMVTITLQGGTTHTIKSSAKPSSVIDGFYIAIDESKPFLAVDSTIYHKIFPNYNQLLSIKVLNAEKINKYQIVKGDINYILEQNDKGWSITSGETNQLADTDKINSLFDTLQTLHVYNVIFDNKIIGDKKSVAEIVVTHGNDTTSLHFYENDSSYWVTNSKRDNEVLEISSSDMESLINASEHYVKEEVKVEESNNNESSENVEEKVEENNEQQVPENTNKEGDKTEENNG